MVQITKAQFVNDLNSYLRTLANNAKNANGTDVSRSGNKITTANLAASTTAELPSTNIRGPELEAYMAEFTKIYSRVRKVNFYLKRNSGNIWNQPWPLQLIYQYTRKANVIVAGSKPDNTRNVEAASVYNNVDPGKDIQLAAYRAILTSLQSTLNSNFAKWYANYNYCHSNCYANINTQRVRR